jgi:uncharacterized coiled-coil protein SlyX
MPHSEYTDADVARCERQVSERKLEERISLLEDTMAKLWDEVVKLWTAIDRP